MNYDYKNKTQNLLMLNRYMLAKSVNMFEYGNLPETIPNKDLEKILQKDGYGFFYEHNNQLYVLRGVLGGLKDVYGNCSEITINNPALNLNKLISIESGVLVNNDSEQLGLLPLYNRYNTMIVENDISMIINTINNRISVLLSAGDDSTVESAKLFLKKIENGDLGVIGENRIFEGVKNHATQNTQNQSITNLIEYTQYVKASLYNEIGLNANYNMKRERLTTSENEMNQDILYPLIMDMYENRRLGIEKVNHKFDTNITVDFSNIWKKQTKLLKGVNHEIKGMGDDAKEGNS